MPQKTQKTDIPKRQNGMLKFFSVNDNQIRKRAFPKTPGLTFYNLPYELSMARACKLISGILFYGFVWVIMQVSFFDIEKLLLLPGIIQNNSSSDNECPVEKNDSPTCQSEQDELIKSFVHYTDYPEI